MPQAKRENIKRHLEFVSRPRDPFQNPETLREIQTYIENAFLSDGYRVEKHAFDFQGQTFENVIATPPCHPEKAEDGRLIIAAHFDAVPGSPGADDNATGVAAMLEAARVLADRDRSQKKGSSPDVQFVAFNLEEYGMVGSTEYVKTLKERFLAADIKGMISLEMIGFTSGQKGSQNLPLFLKPFYPDTGNFLALVGDGNSKKLLKQAKKAFKSSPDLPVQALTLPGKGRILPETRLSDHSPFWDAGIPALLVTDTSFFRNPYYHTAEDTLDTLDLDFLLKVTEGVIRFAES